MVIGRGAVKLGAANCLPESLICYPNELLSSRNELRLFWGKSIGTSEEACRMEWVSAQLKGVGWGGGCSPFRSLASYVYG